MPYEQKPETGSLFRNKNRTKDTQSHAQGSALIDGVEYYVDAWTNTKNDGEKYQSLKFKRKESQREPQPTRQAQRELDDPRTTERQLDDEIPF